MHSKTNHGVGDHLAVRISLSPCFVVRLGMAMLELFWTHTATVPCLQTVYISLWKGFMTIWQVPWYQRRHSRFSFVTWVGASPQIHNQWCDKKKGWNGSPMDPTQVLRLWRKRSSWMRRSIDTSPSSSRVRPIQCQIHLTPSWWLTFWYLDSLDHVLSFLSWCLWERNTGIIQGTCWMRRFRQGDLIPPKRRVLHNVTTDKKNTKLCWLEFNPIELCSHMLQFFACPEDVTTTLAMDVDESYVLETLICPNCSPYLNDPMGAMAFSYISWKVLKFPKISENTFNDPFCI